MSHVWLSALDGELPHSECARAAELGHGVLAAAGASPKRPLLAHTGRDVAERVRSDSDDDRQSSPALSTSNSAHTRQWSKIRLP
jgi:hypothetical protein